MQIGDEININNISEEGMEDLFSNLLKEVVVYTNKNISAGKNNRKLNVNLEVTPMLKGAVSVYSVLLSCNNTVNPNEGKMVKNGKNKKTNDFDTELKSFDYSKTLKINKKRN